MLVVQHPIDDFHVVWNCSFHSRPFPNESDDEAQMMTSYLEQKKTHRSVPRKITGKFVQLIIRSKYTQNNKLLIVSN